MADLSLFIIIWAAVGASGLGVGGVGVYLTRRRFRSVALPYARAHARDDLSTAV